MIFLGGGFADDVMRFLGLGPDAAEIWNVARWPGALIVAMFVFAFVYYVTPDIRQRSFRAVAPGAAAGVLLWLAASVGFATYVSQIANIGAIYGAFAGAIVLVGWLWLSNVALLFGAELNAEIERERELDEGVPHAKTLNRPERGP
jgi:membrane protein